MEILWQTIRIVGCDAGPTYVHLGMLIGWIISLVFVVGPSLGFYPTPDVKVIIVDWIENHLKSIVGILLESVLYSNFESRPQQKDWILAAAGKVIALVAPSATWESDLYIVWCEYYMNGDFRK